MFALNLAVQCFGLLLEVLFCLMYSSSRCLLHFCFGWPHDYFSDTEALSRLNNVIRHPDARNSDNVMAYDNAVSALGKICQFHRDSIDAAQVVSWIFLVFVLSFS